MTEFLTGGYLWFKAIHVIAMIAWMAALLYLPRLYVYHCETEVGSAESERFKVMERKLLRGIMNPSMIAAWIFGLITAWSAALWSDGWFHAKLLLVVILTVMHMAYARWRRLLAADRREHSGRFYRIMNEVPAVLMIAIVILVVVKPF